MLVFEDLEQLSCVNPIFRVGMAAFGDMKKPFLHFLMIRNHLPFDMHRG
jgi:hypothetical protein